MSDNPSRPKKFGEILIEAGTIDEDQLELAIKKSRESFIRVGEALVVLGFATDEEIAKTLSEQLNIPHEDCRDEKILKALTELIPEAIAEKYTLLPLKIDEGSITIVMADPTDYDAIQDIRFITGRKVIVNVATHTKIKECIKAHYNLSVLIQDIISTMDSGKIELLPEHGGPIKDLEPESDKDQLAPIIKMVNSIIYSAIMNRASDIHIEPRENNVVIRERVDGLLRKTLEFPKWIDNQIVSRIKIISSLDIAEKRKPQDGRMKVLVEGRYIDLRVSTLPIQYGESVVLRILDKSSAVTDLDAIGADKYALERIKNIIDRPQGVVLTTGPTGSGKSSMLYAMINHLKSEEINIVSIEDPIEYELEGLNQIAINEKAGLSFVSVLRSTLRQDPDIVMVGEMRDVETAEVAVQAALTGHLVLSSIHTNSAVSAIKRLENLGIDTHLIATSLNGIIAQRLLRKLCDGCKEPHTLSDKELINIGLDKAGAKGGTFFKAKGCPACTETGYMGRIGTFEVLVNNANLTEAIIKDATEHDLLEAARAGGMKCLSEDGISKVKAGITSVDELLRVLYIDKSQMGEANTIKRNCENCGEEIEVNLFNCNLCKREESEDYACDTTVSTNDYYKCKRCGKENKV